MPRVLFPSPKPEPAPAPAITTPSGGPAVAVIAPCPDCIHVRYVGPNRILYCANAEAYATIARSSVGNCGPDAERYIADTAALAIRANTAYGTIVYSNIDARTRDTLEIIQNSLLETCRAAVRNTRPRQLSSCSFEMARSTYNRLYAEISALVNISGGPLHPPETNMVNGVLIRIISNS